MHKIRAEYVTCGGDMHKIRAEELSDSKILVIEVFN